MKLGDDRSTKATLHPTITQLYWAAGFLEGEGNFSSQLSRGSVNYSVSAKQVNPDPLCLLVCLFGGTISYSTRENENTMVNSQPIFRYCVSGARARGIAMTLYSLMSSKRKAQIFGMLKR